MIWKGRPIFRENRKFFLQAVVISGILKNKLYCPKISFGMKIPRGFGYRIRQIVRDFV